MKPSTHHNTRLSFRAAFAAIFLVLVATACGLIWPARTTDGQVNPVNGERIYFTAASERRSQITYRGGPAFGGMMMGSFLTCAACHGPDGRGGTHWMHMQVMDAPDIRITALSQESEEHGGEEHGEGGFDLQKFRKAVIEGMHPDGESLSQDMPRWQMGEEDLKDLFAFLQSLP